CADLPPPLYSSALSLHDAHPIWLSEAAWKLFGQAPLGWGRVQAICDYVHRHIVFGYEHARMTRTALEAFHDRTGVCRDYAHLAVDRKSTRLNSSHLGNSYAVFCL